MDGFGTWNRKGVTDAYQWDFFEIFLYEDMENHLKRGVSVKRFCYRSALRVLGKLLDTIHCRSQALEMLCTVQEVDI